MAHATTSVACAARTMGMSGSLRRCAYCTLHQAAFAAVAHGLGPVARGELAQDRAHVELYRALTDAQRGGDGFVRLALGNPLEDFRLARGQRILVRAFPRVS